MSGVMAFCLGLSWALLVDNLVKYSVSRPLNQNERPLSCFLGPQNLD